MIECFTGTIGSGKSLDACRLIYKYNKEGRHVVANFPVKLDGVDYLPNEKLKPKALVELWQKFEAERETDKYEEDWWLLVIDEAQVVFSPRLWADNDRNDWIKWLSQSRKMGCRVILVSQQMRGMIDKMIIPTIEYDCSHRMAKNFGWVGKIVSFGGRLCWVNRWYAPLGRTTSKNIMGRYVFLARKKYFDIYDTRNLFNIIDSTE